MLLLFACAFFGFVHEAKGATGNTTGNDSDKLKELQFTAYNQSMNPADYQVGNLNPAFDPDVLSYTLDLPSRLDRLNIKATAMNPVSQIMILANGSAMTGTTAALEGGRNTFQFQVNSGRGAIRTYTIYVNRVSPSGLAYYDSSKDMSDQQMEEGQKFCIPYSVIGSNLTNFNVAGSPKWSFQWLDRECGQDAYSYFDPNATGMITLDLFFLEQRTESYCSYDRWGNCTRYWNTYYVTVQKTMKLGIAPINDPPIVRTLQDVKMKGNEPSLDLPIAVTDIDTARENIQITVDSSNTALVPKDWLIVSDLGQAWNLRIQPTPGQKGSSVITVTAFDGESSASSSFTVTVDDALNIPPVVNDTDQWISKEKTLHFQEDDFVSLYSDEDGDPLQQVRITRLPEHGELLLKGASVTLQQEIARAELSHLAYKPAVGWNGIDSFSWRGSDGKEYSGAAVYTIGTDINVLKELRIVINSPTLNPADDRTVPLDHAFNPDVPVYSFDLSSQFAQLDITATALDSASQITMTVNGTPATGTTIALANGRNTIGLQVNSGRGDVKTYTIYANRVSPSGLAYYDSSKTMSDQQMEEGQKFCIPYSVMGSNLSTFNVAGSPKWSFQSLDRECGQNAYSYFDPNANGTITLDLSFLEQRTESYCSYDRWGNCVLYWNTYYVTVQKPVKLNIASVNDPPIKSADLTDLKVNGITVTGFVYDNIGPYHVSIPNQLSWVDITYTKSDNYASVAIQGDAYLSVGENTVTVTVTAEDGTKKVYTIIVNREEASGNADLSGLTLSSGELSPAFGPGTTAYTAAVPNSVTSITVTASVYDSKSTMTVNGNVVASGEPSGAIHLNVGNNTITIVVTAQNGTTKTYKVTVTRAAEEGGNTGPELSSNADLNGLTLSSGELSPSYASGTTAYTATVPNSVTSFTVTASVYDSKSTMTVNGNVVASGEPSGAIHLNVGNNTITIVVTAQNGTTKTYTVTVTRAAEEGGNTGPELSSNADLSSLTLSSGELSPAFVPGTTAYTAAVPNSVTSITVTASVYDNKATMTVNGNAVASGEPSGAIHLNVGNNTITIVVTAQNSTTKTYKVTVTRAAEEGGNTGPELSSNADLNGLTLSSGELSPAFVPGTTAYTAAVPNSVTSFTVTASVYDSKATMTVNGNAVASGEPSGAIHLNVGNNAITIVVTAQNSTTKTYKVTVTRAAEEGGNTGPELSSNADLNGLTLSSGELSPAFVPGTTAYTATVPNSVTSFTVTASVYDSKATMTVNGNAVASGVPSGAIHLNVGNNAITIVVTAQNSTTKTYKVTVTRAAEEGGNTGPELSSNADLNGVTLSSGELSPAFVPGTTAYTAAVPNSILSLTVTAIVYDSKSTMTVNGNAVASGEPSGAIHLNVGNNTITIVVTAQNGTTKTYKVTVTRAAEEGGNTGPELSSNADLSGLALSSGELSPAFVPGTTAYTAAVPNSVTSFTVTASVYDSKATMTVNGNAVASGEPSGAVHLQVGSNPIVIVVTAQNGTTKTYKVTVTRAAEEGGNTGPELSSNADLSGLTMSSGELSPAFVPGTIVYTAMVPNSVSSLTVTASVYDSKSTMTVNGNAVASGVPSDAVHLQVGSNPIVIVVTAQNGTTKTYKVTVTRAAEEGGNTGPELSSNADLSGLTMSSGELSPAFVPGTIVYTAMVPNSVSSLTVTASAQDSGATITVNGNTVASGEPSGAIYLNAGNNAITIAVTAQNGAGKTYTINVTRASSSRSPSSPSSNQSTPINTNAVSIDGVLTDAPVTKEMTDDGQAVTKVTIDADKLAKILVSGQNSVIAIEVNNTDPVVKVELPASALLDAASKKPGVIVQIKVDGASYSLPVSALKNVPKDTVVTVIISKVSGKTNDDVNAAAAKLGVKPLLGNPVDFKVSFSGKDVTDFNGKYVDRTLILKSAADFQKATAVWIDASNKLHFIPSSFSDNTVTIHSSHNSIYTVIQSDKAFADLEGHWAKADVEMLANKLVVEGAADNTFAPDNNITRAEFAALLVRSLGLLEENPVHPLTDVNEGDWYAGAVGAAQKAGLISGYEEGDFKPNASITREEMVAMIARALKVGGIEVKTDAKALDRFADKSGIADWAKDAAAQMLAANIVQGMTNTTFAAKENATRAQSASLLKRMLQYMHFIN
ncbi:cadherin-like beta sandwich domain-containing protein [Paenibacillus hamazuiensis]|uniref:cadherin-like beta sandwich domain-containing protein n=1 Tax=Paenibacillus hamazuiensis TaxID=2936508 RepID=UPI00200DB0AE|nr:cadherin-like beta sandwich domain-containing protein [Paenibacillus hamazuiensis]